MEKLIPIETPWKGLSEAFAFSEQPEATAREFQNMRLLDPTNGRARMCQRSGQTKYLTSALKAAGTKVADMISFTVDNRQVTYSALSTETATWSVLTPAKSTVYNIKTDRQGNVYALDGNAGIVKYSADGNLVWQLTLPVADPRHIVRALAVDEFDNIYAGVSAGATSASSTGDQATARVWGYRQVVDQAPEQMWQREPGAYTEDMLVRDGKLYTVQNKPDRKKSYVRIYDFAGTIDPTLSKEWRIPHPANSIAVKKDGSVIVACEPSTQVDDFHMRESDPKFPELRVDSVDWTPRQLPNSDRRIWSWYIGDSIDQSDCATSIGDGVELIRWRDDTKNARHLFAAIDEGTTGSGLSTSNTDVGPSLALDALLEHKGLRWTATGTVSPLQVLKSLPNATTSKAFADNQRTMIPAYVDSAFALYIVMRPSSTTNEVLGSGATDNLRRWVWGQDRDGATSGSVDHILFINSADDSAGTLPPTETAGRIFWYTSTTGMSGGDGPGVTTIRDGYFSTKQDGTTANPGFVTITSQIWDGSLAGDSQAGLFQINGFPVDSFSSGTTRSTRPTYLGSFRIRPGVPLPNPGVSSFLGDIVEIICLDRSSRSNEAANVLTFDDLEHDSGAASQTINENTAIVGYLAHKYGAWLNLPYSNAAVNNYPHPFGVTGSGQDRLAGPPRLNSTGSAIEVSTPQALANKRWGCVVKYSADGKIVWTANEQELIGGVRSGGYGYAVAVNSDGNIYSVGPTRQGTGSHDSVGARLIIDQGSDFSIQVADGAWSDAFAASELASNHQRIDVDEFDNLYIPFGVDLGTGGVRVYSSTGSQLHNATSPVSGDTPICVAIDRRIPDYRNDITPKRAEHVFFGTSWTGTSTDETLHKMRLVLSTQASGSTRSLVNLGVSGGDIVTFTTSAVATPTGGSGALDSAAKYVQSTTLYKRAYFTDGRQYKQYDPVEDEVSEFKCLSSGAMPSRCALIETWRGRIVLARSADEPHNWFLSKKDDPTNWDFFPPTPTEIDAVAGNNSLAGLCPDIINSVVPYSEDILVFGGDHSIWMLVGDPAAGGRLELVSDITGMAFGRPWCKDPNGLLYFVGSRGGLFKWVPGAKPERISLYRIERQLQEIDFSTHYVRLVWNYKDEGLHIFQCPFGAGGTRVSHWFWEQKTDSFSKDLFGTTTYTNVQPCAVMVIDGDDFDDRLLLIGGEDGRVRKWDSAARSDDTRTDLTTKIPIDSYVTLFPIIPPSEFVAGMETQFSGLSVVLGDREAGCRYELFSSDEPDSFGAARKQGQLSPGRNAPKWEKVVGAFCGLRLRNAAQEERWAFERGMLYASPAGLVRPRGVN